MFDTVIEAGSHAFRRDEAEELLRRLAAYDRLPASQGFVQAAAHLQTALEGAGIACKLHAFPVDRGKRYWGQPGAPAWQPKRARLILMPQGSPGRVVASLADHPLALIEGSAATPRGGVETDLVAVERGEDDQAYRRVDVRDKIVLTSGDPDRVRRLAVERYGAAGIVLDGVGGRRAGDAQGLEEALPLASFRRTERKPAGFGFVVSRRHGAELRKAVSQHSGLRVWAEVETEFGPGEVCVFEAIVPGGPDEVWLLADLAGRAGMAGSATGAALGAAALLAVQRSGRSKLHRTIRLIITAEPWSLAACLASGAADPGRAVSGLDLSYLGADGAESPLHIYEAPAATPGCGADVLEGLVEIKCRQDPSGALAYRRVPFAGWGNQEILGDPMVGVNVPRLSQSAAARFWTSEDRLARLQASVFQAAGEIAASYLLWWSGAGPREGANLAGRIAERFEGELRRHIEFHPLRAEADRCFPSALVEFHLSRRLKDLASLERLKTRGKRAGAELDEALARSAAALDAAARRAAASYLDEEKPHKPRPLYQRFGAASLRPVRLALGLAAPGARDGGAADLERLQRVVGAEPSWYLPRLWFGADGNRTLGEIVERAAVESGIRDFELAEAYFRLLEREGLCRLEPGSQSPDSLLYFAYGSCMSRRDFRRTVPEFELVGAAVLEGYRLAFTMYSESRAGGVADVVPHEGSRVFGILYRLPASGLPALDVREGVPDGKYRHEYVTVRTLDGRVYDQTLTYTVIDKEPEEAPPSPAYGELLLEGARGLLPDEYVRSLEERLAPWSLTQEDE